MALAVLAVRLAGRPADEAKLVRRLKARDPKAMSEIYDRYGRLVYSLIHRVVRDAGVAEDLTQETFLRVWNRAQAIEVEQATLAPWIMTVARNRAIDYLRSTEGRVVSRSLELAAAEHPSKFHGVGAEALSVERARRLQEAFEKLTPSQKTVIELAYYEGLSLAEIAEHMQQPLGTVNTWVQAALRTMREHLAEAAAVA